MTDTFTASNGLIITLTNAGQTGYCPDYATGFLDFSPMVAWREFFRAERDEELGRWRWRDNPGYVVYPTPDGRMVNVLKESNGHCGQFDRDQFAGMMAAFDTSDPGYSRAARAYFEAHPERKPWEDAKPGEVWLLTVCGREAAYVADQFDFNGTREAGAFISFELDYSDITAGRRIWPEDAS